MAILSRDRKLSELQRYLQYSPVTAILGPRQSGKTTLAKMVKADHYFDLENPRDLARLEHPQLALERLKGMVVIDEVQLRPDLFPLIRFLVDEQPDNRYLILGSASRDLIRQGNETLAGRIFFHYLNGFNLQEVGVSNWRKLWLRGGYPRAFMAEEEGIAQKWLDDYISTFLERDIPQFGIRTPAATLRRFWIMLSHYHGNVVNYSELGRSLQLNDKTVRAYIDILESTFMVRVLSPWFNNTSKRLVKSPKIYLTDSGIFHRLQLIDSFEALEAHPRLGASWEGFAMQQCIELLGLPAGHFFFWATSAGAEVDLLWQQNGKSYAIEFKYSDAPKLTHSMKVALEELELDHLWVVYPGTSTYPVHERVTVLSIVDMPAAFSAGIDYSSS